MLNFLKQNNETEHKPGLAFGRVINFCLYLLVFLVPLLFSSLTFEFREFNKQALIFVVVLVGLGIWLIKNLVSRKFSWVKTPLDFILLGYLAVYLLTSLASVDKPSSFLGYYVRFTGSFMALLGFIFLYYLVVQNVRTAKVSRRIMNTFAISSGIVLVYSLLQLFGKYILPFDFTKSQSFNPIGSLAALAVFSSVCIVFYLWMLMNINRNQWRNILLSLGILVGLMIMLLINSFVAWLVLALTLIAFLAITVSVTEPELFQSWFWKPMLVLVVAVLFVAFQFLPNMVNPQRLIKIKLPTELQLSSKATWGLVKTSLSGTPKNLILGSGPGTLGIEFGNIKPVELNKTIVWSVNFDKASSEIANKTIESGILGVIVFELLSVLFIVYALYYLFRKAGHKGYFYALGAIGIWLPLYITHFFYFFNTTFDFLFWFSMALFMAVSSWSPEAEAEHNLSLHSPRATLSAMFVSLLLLAGILFGVFWQVTVWAADVSYASGIKKLNHPNPNFAEVEKNFDQAVGLNPYRDVYQLALGQDLYFEASQEAGKKPPNVQQIQVWVKGMIDAVRKATELSPNKAANWSAKAQFYGSIKALVTDADKFIIEAWQQAIDKDPKNPILYAQKAQALIISSESIDPAIAGSGKDADSDGLSDDMEAKFGSDPKKYDTNGNGISDGDDVKDGHNPKEVGDLAENLVGPYKKIDSAKLKEAETDLHKAIDLKADLPDPYIQLAKILEKSNRLSEAKSQLDLAASLFPNNPDVLFEQGLVTYNQQKIDEAEKIFKQVVALVPNHANALFSLGEVYRVRGDLTTALSYYNNVRAITGPNVRLEQLITNVKAALEKTSK